MLPSEVPGRRLFYHYYFNGIEGPLTIEAANKKESSQYVLDHINKVPDKRGIVLRNMRISQPIFGVTERTEKEVTYIWCGRKYHPSGWMKKEDFINQNIYNNDQR